MLKLFFAFILVTLLYQNCSQPGDLGLAQSPQSDDPMNVQATPEPINDPNEPGSTQVVDLPIGGSPSTSPPAGGTTMPYQPPSETVIHDRIMKCNDLKAKNKLTKALGVINFADTRVEYNRINKLDSENKRVCEFATDKLYDSIKNGVKEYRGNLDMDDNFVRARYTQNRLFSLPEGAVLCDMSIESKVQSFYYDDMFYISYNGVIIASNHRDEFISRLQGSYKTNIKLTSQTNTFINFYTYNWLAIRGVSFDSDKTDNDYCIGKDELGSNCSWPKTEKEGTIMFNLASELLIRMFSLKSTTQQTLQFVITGDNNPTDDCYHENLDLNLEIQYYIPTTTTP